ncbi:MAG: Gfo/Idh/MocA family oxidoreductase [Flavobacteriaceae bacterium]|nr:Gfo/Idh/MocA family oxidoreductase [Flavobacteriaceae bacterium]
MRHGVERFYDDAEQLINDPEIHAIYIATPPDTHLYYALKVAEAGKICCVEKPMAVNYTESLQMLNAFSKKKIPLFIAYYRRSLPRFNQIKKWLEDEEIGQVRHIHWTLCEPPNKLIDRKGNYNWRTDANIALGGYFDDLASHGLDLFHYLLGEFKAVSGHSMNQQNLYSAKDAVAASWIHKSGVTGTGAWNFGTRQKEDTVTIYGEMGTIIFFCFQRSSCTAFQ